MSTIRPYRTLEDPAPGTNPDATDPAMVFALGLLILASAVRVVAAVALHEAFGGEATLAFLVLFVTAGWAAGALVRTLRAIAASRR